MIENYEVYKEQGRQELYLPLIDGIPQTVALGALAGFCACPLHKGYLDIKTLHKKECEKKGCNYLRKYESYPYWTHKRNRKAEKEKSKRQKAQALAIEKKAQKRLDRIKEVAQDIAEDMFLPMVITRVTSKCEGEYTINYVSYAGYNDWSEFFDLILELNHIYKGRYTLNHVKTPDGNYATISDLVYARR